MSTTLPTAAAACSVAVPDNSIESDASAAPEESTGAVDALCSACTLACSLLNSSREAFNLRISLLSSDYPSSFIMESLPLIYFISASLTLPRS